MPMMVQLVLSTLYRRLQVAQLHPAVCHICWRTRNVHRPLYRFFTSEEGDELEVYEGPIPRDKVKITFSRSSGPGGQNVNKLNTKAEVRLHVDSADWMPLRVRSRLKSMFKTRVNKEGEVIVVSQKHRSQHKNMEDAISKLERLIYDASEVPKGPSELTRARIKLLKRKSERQRLVEKKYHSRKKTDRSTHDF